MATGIPVNNLENSWRKHFFRVLGVLVLMGGISVAALAPDGAVPGIILGGVAIVLLVVNEVKIARQKDALRRVLDTGTGFRWLGGPVEIEVADSQVVAVRIARKSKFSAGILKGTIRRFEVWIAGSDQPMRMANRIAVDGVDPLAALIARVIDDLKQRTAAGLAGGAMLEGDGWRLAATQLLVRRGRTAESLPFGEIEKVAVFDGKLCLWRNGQDEPATKIDPASKNAAVLAALVNEWIEHQRGASGGEPAAASGASGMGRLLFQRQRDGGLWLGVIFAVIGAVAGGISLLNGDPKPFGVALLITALAALGLGIFFGRYLFRCYELGLTRRRGRNEFRLLYDEIKEFTFAATRMFYKGSYIGTRLSLIFRSPRGTIRYSAKVQNVDADLDDLRDEIAKRIAIGMLEELRAGRRVSWANDVTFLPEGLQFRRSKMLGLANGPVEVLPYGQIRGVNLDQGVFSLYSKAEAKPVISRPSSSANFFPGYYAVLTLLAQNIPSSSRASSVINSGVQGGESVTSTFTSPAPSSAVNVSRTSATSWGP